MATETRMGLRLEALRRQVGHPRAVSYLVVAGGLFVAFLFARNVDWQGSADLHTLMEALATLLALVVGAMALVRFYSKKTNLFLFVGTGFLGTAFLDGYHAVVTSAFFAAWLPSSLSSLIPWSWVASRIFLSIFLWMSWVLWRREMRLGEAGQIGERGIFLLAGVMTAASFLFFVFVPLPRAYYPEVVLHRPQELVPALFFLLALIGYLQKGRWRDNAFEHWLVLSLIVGFMGQAMFMSLSGRLFDTMFDLAHLLKKASYVCVLTGLVISMFYLFRQAEEGRVRVLQAYQDLREEVAERERAERDLQVSESRFRSLTQAANDAVISADQAGNIFFWNRGAETIFGYREEEVLGKPLTLLMPERYHEAHRTGIERVGGGGEHHVLGRTVELHGLRKDGTEFPVELSLGSWVADDERFYVGVLRDITDRKRAEEDLQELNRTLEERVDARTGELQEQTERLARSNAELEQFAYVASHDLQEPLRMVASYLQLLQRRYEGQLDEDADEFIGFAVDGASRMKTLIEDLLAFSRVGTRGQEFGAVDCEVVLGTALDNLEAAIGESEAVVTHDPLPTVAGDDIQLLQVFQNLISNAIKFRSKEPPRVHVGAQREDGAWRFSVQDNGVGIDPKHVERVFVIFQRLHKREEKPGTGIGLAICKKIVERHGGTIWVESGADGGSTFYFTLPVQDGGPA